MIITTTESVLGKTITAYCGIVGTEVIFGANFLKDWDASATDFLGGRNNGYEKVYEDARKKALEEIGQKAQELKADAVVALRLSYQVMGEKNGMMMVAAVGTGVRLEMSREERDRLRAAQAIHEARDVAAYMVLVDGKVRGPFSIIQLESLLSSGKVLSDAVTTSDVLESGRTVSELVKWTSS